MPILIDYVVVALFFLGFVGLVTYIAVRHPIVGLSFLFILITLVWRATATAYIDLAGPIYSSQLLRHIGPGMMTPLHVVAYALTLIPFFFFFNKARIAKWQRASGTLDSRAWITLGDVVFFSSILFLIGLYADLLRAGVVPVLSRMDRFEFTNLHAGPLHHWLLRFGNLLSCLWGATFAATYLREGGGGYRFVALLGLVLFYLFLTGNRFSAFYSYGSFFILPCAAIVAARSDRPRRSKNVRQIAAFVSIGLFAVILSAVAIFNNLTRVRSSDPESPLVRFTERVLIQPSEVGWISYERIFLQGQWQPTQVLDAVFLAPVDAARNTTPQYFMLQMMGEPRFSQHLKEGAQLAGGFPEIFFELFGPYFAWPVILLAAFATALITAIAIRGIVSGQYLTTFWATYVLYSVLIMYISGMLNFLINWIFWAKVVCLVVSLMIDRELARLGIAVPWLLVKRPSTPSERPYFQWR